VDWGHKNGIVDYARVHGLAPQKGSWSLRKASYCWLWIQDLEVRDR
jgi:hypothetical protein